MAARGTQAVASNVGDLQRGANETGSASSQVLGSARELSQQSARLKSEVGKLPNSVRAAQGLLGFRIERSRYRGVRGNVA